MEKKEFLPCFEALGERKLKRLRDAVNILWLQNVARCPSGVEAAGCFTTHIHHKHRTWCILGIDHLEHITLTRLQVFAFTEQIPKIFHSGFVIW